MEQQLGASQLGRRRRFDRPRAHPPGRMDLVPAVLRIGDPRPDDLDPRAFGRHRDPRTVLRNDLDDEVAANPAVAVGEQALVAWIEPKVDVDVAVVGLELDVGDGADRDPAAALHLQALRVVDARERAAAAAVRRGRRGRPAQAVSRDAEDEQNAENRPRPPHRPRVPASSRGRKSLFRTPLRAGLHLPPTRT